MNFFYYLLEANIYCCILYAFYRFVLKRETFYSLNRWYLLGACVIAFTLPLFSITYTTGEEATLSNEPNGTVVYDRFLQIVKAKELSVTSNIENDWTLDLQDTLLLVYAAIAFILLLNLVHSVTKIIGLYLRSSRERKGRVTYVFIAKEEVFSFFSWLFISPKLRDNAAIKAHELIHIQQGHSYDVLFFEILKRINWFNPIFKLLLNDAKLNHEYISDHQVAGKVMNGYAYANLLIKHAYPAENTLTHSAFEDTQLEARLKQLVRRHSSLSSSFKILLAVPLIAVLFFIAAFGVDKSYGALHFTLNKSTPKKAVLSAPIVSRVAKDTVFDHPMIVAKVKKSKLAVNDHQPSELIAGPTALDKIAALLAKKGEKLSARAYLLHWTINQEQQNIRQVAHSVLAGTEAQLFRGSSTDTLYIDQKYYQIEGAAIHVLTDHLMIGYADGERANVNKLVIVDPVRKKIVHELGRVNIKTKGSIYKVVVNPDFRYEKKTTDTLPSKYVNMKVENAKYKFMLTSYNSHVREASIIGNQIITNETNLPKDDPWQQDIIW